MATEILLFEELFENSNVEVLKNTGFDLFQDSVLTFLTTHQAQNENEQKQMLNIEFYSTRMCKSLMKKLSTVTNIEFKTKIQCLLSCALPLNHKSGLNISGKFSEQYKSILVEEKQEELNVENYNKYFNFWTLQKLIVYPQLLF